MKIKILGSGGGEGYPALFCSCEHCNAARKAGGKSIRTLSQTLIDDRLMIDLPADTHWHCIDNGLDLGNIENLLITHTHADHFVPNILDTRGCDFAPVMRTPTLNIYGSADVSRLFDGVFELFPIRDEIRKNIALHVVKPYKRENIGGYTVIPLKANHAPEQVALNYIIDDGKTALLYLLDSGYPTEETLSFIAQYPRKFASVLMDGTMGVNYYVYHMNFAQDKQLKEDLIKLGAADENTRFVVMHITHNHCGLHEEIEEHFKECGITVAYDGMVIENE